MLSQLTRLYSYSNKLENHASRSPDNRQISTSRMNAMTEAMARKANLVKTLEMGGLLMRAGNDRKIRIS
jgi:hypothetical protein